MPNRLITKMQEIVDYNKDAGILTQSSQAQERVRFFSQNGPKLAKISELGEGANQFIYDATRNYAKGLFRAPFTLEKVTKIYEQFAKIDKDLTGAPNSTDEQKAKHHEWNAFWVKQQRDFPQLTETLTKVQQEILAAYRFKVLNMSVFKPKTNSTQKDETHVQDCLQEVNKCAGRGLAPADAYVDLSIKFDSHVEHDLLISTIQTVHTQQASNPK